MDYNIGDIVVKKDKDRTRPQFIEKFIFLGTVNGHEIKIVRDVKDVMGKDVQIGAFVKKPFVIEQTQEWGYRVPVIIASVDLYERIGFVE